jgi:sigma-B regulation protein RsbU (phosphoserine phosphatase)
MLQDTKANQFVSVFYGILDPATGRLDYCNAGHCPPYLLGPHGGDAVHTLRATGMVLGVIEDGAWEQKTVQLAPGDALVLYTDGVTEAQNEQGMFFEEHRLLECVQANQGRSAAKILTAVTADVDQFVGDAPQSDDIALMVLVRDSTEK